MRNRAVEARQLMAAGEYGRALQLAATLLELAPTERELLLTVAACQRQLGRVPAALESLLRLESLYPRFSRLYQERGRCHVAQRAARAAVAAFEQAVRLNPGLPASWQALRALYRMAGRSADAARAANQVSKLASLPPNIVRASVLLTDGEIHEAERLLRRFLLEHGDHIEAIRLLARIALELGVLDDAELLLERVLRLEPGYDAARHDYAVVLLKRRRFAQARDVIDRLLAAEPANNDYRRTAAAISFGLGDHERAIEQYGALLEHTPAERELQLARAHSLKTIGRAAEAVGAYRAATNGLAGFGEAWWGLANLKTYQFRDAEVEKMRMLEATPGVGLSNRYHLCFALGKALEDRGEFAESFAHYAHGNALKRSERHYSADVIQGLVQLQKSICTREFLEARRDWGCHSSAPIFIVGLPRSGSTLLEQILSSHPDIEGTTELAEIPRLAQELAGSTSDRCRLGYPQVLATLGPRDFRRLGERYLTETRVYRRLGRAHFVDKNPNNYRHIGLIRLMLPNARIIDARRGAMACCFGNYKQLFAVGHRFSYDIGSLAHYFRCYIELMSHWESAVPGSTLRIRHEDVVADLERSVRLLLAHCGLEFTPRCLTFFNTERPIETASAEQVRRPIDCATVDRWRNFEPWLGPLRAALGELAND